MAANYIDAQMASSDSLHTRDDFTRDENPELPESRPGSPARADPPEALPLGTIPRDTHWPHWMREDDTRHYDRDYDIRMHVTDFLPELGDLLDQARPNEYVGEAQDAVWRCPTCEYTFCPYDLNREAVQAARELGPDGVVREDAETGVASLDASNPRRFLRYMDSLAWKHLAGHLRGIGIRLTWPNAHTSYREPVAWWLEHEQPSPAEGPFLHALHTMCLRLEHSERVDSDRLREWILIKTLRSARRGQHRARVNITRLRREARARRAKLVARMFAAGANVVTVARGLMRRREKDEEYLLPWRLELNRQTKILREGQARASPNVLAQSRIAPRGF
ncbi:unnamed protein product [Peniophora sp. CBMAI 1063]|nr:unnamed protein product [Peniophora sp. CBMAI 1063]